MAGDPGYRVRRVDPVGTVQQGGGQDYADSFAVELETADSHSPEQWARAALEHASPVVRWIIRLAQVRVMRLQLRPRADPDAVLGWAVVSSTPDALHLRAAGPLLDADIVGRRVSPHVVVLTTSLSFTRRRARLLWVAVGPLHRRIAGHLLRQAAASLTAGGRREQWPKGPSGT